MAFGATSLTRQYGDVLSMTLDTSYQQDEIPDEIFNGLILMKHLKDKIKFKTGGARIRQTAMYGKNSTAKSYRDDDQLDNTRQQTHTVAWYDWKQMAASIGLTGLEMLTNSGPEELFDLYDERYQNAILSLQDAMNTMFFADGTGNGSKDLLGLQAIISSTPTTGTLAQISRVSQTWWRNKQTGSGSFAGQGVTDLRTTWVAVSNNVPTGTPTMLITTPTIYNYYETALVGTVTLANQRYVRDQKHPKGPQESGDAGIADGAITFKGAPVYWDNAAPSGNIYLINDRYLNLVVHKERNFRPTDRIPMPDQDSWVVYLLFMGELVCSAPRFQGVLTSVTA